jgi:hypothetical protein
MIAYAALLTELGMAHPHSIDVNGAYYPGMAGPLPKPPEQPSYTPGWRQVTPLPPTVVPVPRADPEGLGWAFVPLLTCGFGTSPAFLFAAVRTGSARLGIVAAGYGVGSFAAIVFLGAIPPLGALLLMILWVVGSGHAFAARPKVYPPRTPRDRLNQHAVEAARYRRGLRDEARNLIAEDPGLAYDLGIGRPDLPRVYDDGGLIDVNHAPSRVLAILPGMTDELVSRVVQMRDEHGAFVSAEELALDAELPPDVVPMIAEYGIFLP